MTSGQDTVVGADSLNTGGAGRALLWSFTNTIVGRFGTVAISVILARLLGPQEFGTYAVAFVALIAVLSFNELGVSLAIVRWKDDPRLIAPTVTAISLGMSAFLTVAMVAAAPVFARSMGDPGATPLVQLMSLCVLINGVVATPAALMERMFRQRQRLVVDQVNVWVGALVSVGLAAAGIGAASLVIGRLSGAGLSALLFLWYSPLPYRVKIERKYVRPLFEFGLPLAGASMVVFLVGFVDQLVVGRTLGSYQLGFYVLAVNLAAWPVTLFSQPLRNVAPAMFARWQHRPAQMRQGFGQILHLLASITLPTCLVISACSPDIVRFVYGPAWAPAGNVLRWLAVLAALRIFFELAYDFMVILGRSHSILVIQLFMIVFLVPALVVGVHLEGIVGAAMALVLVATLVSLPLYLAGLHRAQISMRAMVVAVRMPLLAALLAAAFSLAVLGLTGGTFVHLAISGLGLGGICSLLVWRYRHDLSVFTGRGESVDPDRVG